MTSGDGWIRIWSSTFAEHEESIRQAQLFAIASVENERRCNKKKLAADADLKKPNNRKVIDK